MKIEEIYNLGKFNLFPICRSLTGLGNLKTLKIIKKKFKILKIKKFKCGTKVFDWKIPEEWNIKNAYILDKNKKKIIDFNKNNLHVVGYSSPVNLWLNKKTLLSRLHSIEKKPAAIPYITSFYKKYWGFCTTHKQKKEIIKNYDKNDKFKVVINSNFKKNGRLLYGEVIIPGISKQEILISTYICHPSMANNELSGPLVSLCLINYFQKFKKLKKTLRFIFIPETIGSIAYLSKNLDYLKKYTVGGYNLSCIGDERQYSCMLSKYKNAQSDIAILKAFKKLKIKYKLYSFLERGSDERQYNSPNIDLPIASIFRSKYHEYPEYHTSLDNFKLVTLKGIKGGYKISREAIKILMKMTVPKNLIFCEPQMGRRGLYPSLSFGNIDKTTNNLMNFLQYADGKNDMQKISKLIKISLSECNKIYKILCKKKIVI
jgi:aminopeptidase-like protein